MKLLKELLYLIFFLLFTTPKHYKLLEIKKSKYFPVGSSKMMWCGVVIHKGEFEQWMKDKSWWMRMNIRLYQARTHHLSWITFYLYFWLDIFIGSLYCCSWRGGFYTSPYIIEEYVKEDNNYYLSDYSQANLRKFHLTYSERGMLWKEIGGDSEKWLDLIKNM